MKLLPRAFGQASNEAPDAAEAAVPVEPADEFWSPYMTAGEAALRVPGLAASPPAAGDDEVGVELDDADAAPDEVEGPAGVDPASGIGHVTPGIDADAEVDAGTEVARESDDADAWSTAVAAAVAGGVVETDTAPTDHDPAPPPSPPHPVETDTDSTPAPPTATGPDASLTPPHPDPALLPPPRPGTVPEPTADSPLPPPPPDTAIDSAPPPPPDTHAAIESPLPPPPPDTAIDSAPPPPPDTHAAIDSPLPPPPPDTHDPFLPTTEPHSLAPLTADTHAAIESALPPPPPVPEGERMDWSLRGTPDDDALFAPAAPATTPAAGPAVLLGTDSGTTTSLPTTMCPTCRSTAKIDLIDRQRGLQHLSCATCYRVWQSPLED